MIELVFFNGSRTSSMILIEIFMVNRNLLEFFYNFRILWTWKESDLFRLLFDGLVKELFKVCVIFFIVFAISNVESVIPCPGVDLFLL